MKRVCLAVIDGWGHGNGGDGDAINESECYWMRRLSLEYKSFLIAAHGSHVGLLPGLMGNSEVGHLTIGAGRVIEQDVLRIENAIDSGEMDRIVSDALKGCKSRIHLVGMLSDGGVHSHIKHLKAMLSAMRNYKMKIYIHCISDGRDTAPCVFLRYLSDMVECCEKLGVGEIASVAGRFYTMDRANNNERTSASFEMMTGGSGTCASLFEHVDEMYRSGLTDETFSPFLVTEEGKIQPEDAVIFFNFRADRMRQIVDRFIKNGNKISTMTEYKREFPVKVLFKKPCVENTLAEVLSSRNTSHVHIAEKEKQAHVTYFFNGGRESMFPKQKVIILPSPDVPSFNTVPEMASKDVTAAAIEEMQKGTCFVVLNLAPPDMVGHTGDLEATRKAVKAADDCIGLLYESCSKNGYVLVITADHGNAEEMKDIHGNCCKTHTTNKVPLIICGCEKRDKVSSKWGYVDSGYSLRDVAPTILDIMDIEKPREMTGVSVLDPKQ